MIRSAPQNGPDLHFSKIQSALEFSPDRNHDRKLLIPGKVPTILCSHPHDPNGDAC